MSIYEKGIKFTCKKCGKCCISERDDMCVHLYLKDIKNISSLLNISKLDFIKKYCILTKDTYIFDDCSIVSERIEIKKKDNGLCIFLEKNLCSVYSKRPYICEYGPFTQGFMNSKKYLELFRGICSGIDNGKLHSKESIENILKKEELLEDEYETDLLESSFLKSIFASLKFQERKIIIKKTYEDYFNSND